LTILFTQVFSPEIIHFLGFEESNPETSNLHQFFF